MSNSKHHQRLTTFDQDSAYQSPWSLKTKVLSRVWFVVWLVAFRPTPKKMKTWRNSLLRFFGASIAGSPFISPSARITMPWKLRLEDHATLGEGVIVYNLGHVTLKARSTVAQFSYLCAGSHDVNQRTLPLITGPITIGEDVFVGAKAMILPGVFVGKEAVVGAGSVVTKDVQPHVVVAGNPAKPIGKRKLQ